MVGSEIKRFTSVMAAASFAGLTLSACSIFLNPEPNDTLVALAASAQSDAEFFQSQIAQGIAADYNEPLYELRTGNYQQLLELIQDDCGRNENDELPPDCTEEALAEDISIASQSIPVQRIHIQEAATQIEETFFDAPQSSWVALLGQYQQLRFHGAAPATEPQNIAIANVPVTEVQDSLDYLYAAQYALGVAAAFADSTVHTQITAALTEFQEQSGVLQSLNPDAQGPALAYTFDGFVEPVDAVSAAECYRQVLASVQQQWDSMVTNATDAQWQQVALIFSANTALLS